MRYFNHRSRSHLHRTGSLFFLLFCVASWAGAQTAQIPSAEVEKRVDMLLAKMMLDEKIALIGGINDFYIQAIPRLGQLCVCRMVRLACTTMELQLRIPRAFYWQPLGTRNSRDAQA